MNTTPTTNTDTEIQVTFDLLSDERKQEVLNESREINVNDYNWSNGVCHNWETKLEKYGFNGAEIYFSIDSPNGMNGATFSCDKIYIGQYLKNFTKSKSKYPTIIYLMNKDNINNILDCNIIGDTRECMPTYQELEIFHYHNYYGNNYKEATLKKFANEVRDLEADMEETRLYFCQNIYAELETVYENLTSDEAVANTLMDNCMTFDELESD